MADRQPIFNSTRLTRDASFPEADMAERAGDAAPSPDTGKRKTTEQQETPKSSKKARTPPPLVTLRNSRLNLRQKGVGWDRTMPVLRGTCMPDHSRAGIPVIPCRACKCTAGCHSPRTYTSGCESDARKVRLHSHPVTKAQPSSPNSFAQRSCPRDTRHWKRRRRMVRPWMCCLYSSCRRPSNPLPSASTMVSMHRPTRAWCLRCNFGAGR